MDKTENTLRIVRTFRAPAEKVFRAWTDPRELDRWFAPTHGYETVSQVDLRVGGTYRIAMKSPEGSVHTVSGVFREIVPPKKIVYTWKWENKPEMGDTVVTIEFRSLGGSTELTLTHEFLTEAKEREEHNKGWNGCLNRLEERSTKL
jgi:uncharacterized protein YndB with AHSA1/START domain